MSPEKLRATDRKLPNSFARFCEFLANRKRTLRIAPTTTSNREQIGDGNEQNYSRLLLRWPTLKRVAGFSLAAAILPSPGRTELAGDWYLHLDGASRHLHRRDLNEQNWGAGFTYAFQPKDPGQRYLWAVEGDVFKDSLSDPSGYLGASVRRRFRYLDVGVLGFVMYRESADETIGSKVFPGALPFVEFGSERVRFRTTYIPQVTNRDDEAVTLQVLIKL